MPSLASYVGERVLPALHSVSAPRERELEKLAGFLRAQAARHEAINLVYICTHNSRRSHMGQAWAAVAAHHFAFSRVHTFSGGTEATAFNPRAVAAMRRAGFDIDSPDGDNPRYLVGYAMDAEPLRCYSKIYDDEANPHSNFAAVMTCSSADAACPVVAGATLRIVTTYDDPKLSDDTPDETRAYDERCLQIAVETFRAFELATTK